LGFIYISTDLEGLHARSASPRRKTFRAAL
jgi:hypothetical protein